MKWKKVSTNQDKINKKINKQKQIEQVNQFNTKKNLNPLVLTRPSTLE